MRNFVFIEVDLVLFLSFGCSGGVCIYIEFFLFKNRPFLYVITNPV